MNRTSNKRKGKAARLTFEDEMSKVEEDTLDLIIEIIILGVSAGKVIST